MSGSPEDTLAAFERALEHAAEVHFDLTLIVSGASDRSARAIANARSLCDVHLAGRSHLTVVDLHTEPGGDGVVAAPTLVRNLPLPVRRIVGDLSSTSRVLAALDLPIPSWLAATP
jgi:circadian clock protein KaiB